MRSLVRSVLVGCAVTGLALAGSASAQAGDEGGNDTRVGVNKEVSDSGWGSGNDSVIPAAGSQIFGSLVQD
ncbi:hypothetical protein [Streptomyces sp. CRN 30]|uniref:hypothetical protein n=1 Tax=Streptomyces sp. CRN 30 TaxID=3075613 RepID=UPI002A7F3C6A|nr:hypothetical protein [Streptomyces sp. CRN 30]